MNKRLFLIAALLSLQPFVYADETYWDVNLVRNYAHNSELQRRWAFAFLAKNLRQLKGNESVLDIGCGEGKITADVAKFIPDGTVLGIDPSKGMLEWACKQHTSIEYPNVAFREGGFLEPNLTTQYDVIYSTCAFQHCSDQPKALENVAQLLKPQGQLWIMTPSMDNPAWKEAGKTLRNSEKWSIYWQKATPRKFPTVEQYAILLKNAVLKAKRIEKVQTSDAFIDREELMQFLLGTMAPVMPSDLAHQYWNELIDEYLRLSPESLREDGAIEVRFSRVEVEAIKE